MLIIATQYSIFVRWFLSSSFFRRLFSVVGDLHVYRTSTHGMAVVRI